MWWAYIRGGGDYIRGSLYSGGGLIVGGLRYQSFDIWYRKFETGIVRILGCCKYGIKKYVTYACAYKPSIQQGCNTFMLNFGHMRKTHI